MNPINTDPIQPNPVINPIPGLPVNSIPDPIIPSKSPHKPFKIHLHSSYASKVVLPLLLVLVITLATFGVSSYIKNQQLVGSHASAQGVTLSLIPEQKTGAVNETFTLSAVMDTDNDTVSAAELHISYDPASIQIVSFFPGTTLPVILTPETHAGGNISVVLGVQPASPFNGGGILGTWTVKILNTNQTSIQFTSATAVAAIGKTTNDVVAKIGMTVNPKPKQTPTPTPGKSPSPSPTPGGTNLPTIGSFDNATCSLFQGWTCDENHYDQALRVDFYYDGPPGSGKFLGSTTANIQREQAVANKCGGGANHGFSSTTPAIIKDGYPHSIYAYAINVQVGNNPLLHGSPKTITCSTSPLPSISPTPTPTDTVSIVK